MDADDVRKNFYLYRDTNGHGQWSVFPWDKDWTFGIQGDGGPHLSHPFFGDQAHRKPNANQWNKLYEAVFNDPVLQEMYLRRLRTVMDELLQPPGTPPSEGRYEQLADGLVASMGDDRPAGASSSAVKSFVRTRRNTLYNDHASAGPITVLVPEFTSATYFVPGDNSLGRTWTELDFNDDAWTDAETGFGYENTASNFEDLIKTRVKPTESESNSTSLFVRIPFTIEEPSDFNNLTLQMKYDDGFVAYLNGVEVERDNLRTDGPSILRLQSSPPFQ